MARHCQAWMGRERHGVAREWRASGTHTGSSPERPRAERLGTARNGTAMRGGARSGREGERMAYPGGSSPRRSRSAQQGMAEQGVDRLRGEALGKAWLVRERGGNGIRPGSSPRAARRARSARHGSVRKGWVGHGREWQGMGDWQPLGFKASTPTRGWEWHWQCWARQRSVGCGKWSPEWLEWGFDSPARHAGCSEAGLGAAALVAAWQGQKERERHTPEFESPARTQGTARSGPVWSGRARLGRARQGRRENGIHRGSSPRLPRGTQQTRQPEPPEQRHHS